MTKRLLFLCALCMSLAWLGAFEYKNPALNPVKFEAAPSHGEIKLLVDGKMNFVIARAKNDGEDKVARDRRSVTLAEEALVDAFERITGEKPKVVDAASEEAGKAPFVISIGKNAISEKLGIDFNAFPKEGFIVKTFERGVVIAGDDGYLTPSRYHKFDRPQYRFNGTTHGAYDFIERVLGIRFYYPGIGVYAPQNVKDITLTPVCYTDAPVYHNRHHYAFNKFSQNGVPWKGVKADKFFDKAWRFAKTSRFPDPIQRSEERSAGHYQPGTGASDGGGRKALLRYGRAVECALAREARLKIHQRAHPKPRIHLLWAGGPLPGQHA